MYIRKLFCVECRKDVELIVKDKHMEGTLTRVAYRYNCKESQCEYCGSSICVDYITDFNLKSLYAGYREKMRSFSLIKP